MKNTFKLFALLVAASLCTARGWADNVDPANLHFGTGFGTACYAGCGGDPNKITNTFDIYNVSNSQATNIGLTSTNPLLLIISVPNGSPAVSPLNLPSVTFYPVATSSAGTTVGSAAAAGTNTTIYGGPYSFSNSGFTSGSVYNFLNLDPQTDSSNNFNNYTLAKNDPGATSFTVYVFDIFGGTLNANGLVQISFSTPLPLGSITAGYTQGLHNGNPTNYDNAFTEAGIISTTPQVPEPSTIAMLGGGLLMFGGALRRRFSIKNSN